ncbi:hypothetical protein GCM10011607_28250 [Shewanella inventionis]|uniref:Uncharacterized protein n=1 Tax=Shewanella inventionis TaxID=1738770 RepID=A0ABQ1JGD1_9GAMM|nr:hypothetical protein [Shewanella inventionis]GGB65887.1 hypothetical protein GCM10011607_28250 [Shewanella inventionis]
MAIKNLLGGEEIKPLSEVIESKSAVMPHSLFLQSVMEEITSMAPMENATADELCQMFRQKPDMFLSASLNDINNRTMRENVKSRIAEDLMQNGASSDFFRAPKPH